MAGERHRSVSPGNLSETGRIVLVSGGVSLTQAAGVRGR